MRTLNKKYIYLTLIAITGAVSYGFTANHTDFKSSKSVLTAEPNHTNEKKSTEMTPPPPGDIVGLWEDEREQGHKLEFSADGEIKIYSENVVVDQSFYQITNTCHGQTYDGGYLKIIDPDDNSEQCMFIFGINEGANNTLSLMTDTGYIQMYEKQ